MQGFLRDKPLLGDNGAPTPKSGKKAKLTLALPRGKTDLEAQARRAEHHSLGCIDREQDKPAIGPLPKDDVLSDDGPMRNSIQKFTRELRLDGGQKFSLPGGNAMPIDIVRGKAKMVTTQGYLLTPATDDDKPRFVKPRPDRQNRPKRDVVIERKRAPHKSVKAKNNS
ncbi:MAG: hypothetical protein IM509_05620 [Microcystis sp. M31BS1]|uniref:hypothetical protein n=1 Tax=Microcystis sp. M31BS1 TaxID=2771186 RepID=UPI00258F7277|nr:hypothetical protein [Microcystis sp. M31BS1]MCA2590230.1 hypothetical protein [Microcystis sp. M31BS1]